VKNQIVRANLRLVVSVARKHMRPGLSLMELVSDGNITLMRAVESFDIHRGYRFTVALTAVKGAEPLEEVLKRLLRQASAVGVRCRLLLLDRGFYGVGVIRYLQAARTVAAAFPGATLLKDESAGSVIQVTLGAGSPYVVLVPNRLGKAPLPIRKAGLTTPTAAVTIAARTADSNICVK